MSKWSFVVILILSILITYGVSFLDSLMSGTFLAGASGLPFKYSKGTLFGRGNIDYLLLILDIAFWFFVIWLIWWGIKKLIKR